MQGRAGKPPKKEMVIESPQQYKSLAEIEAEVEGVVQVAAVSFSLKIVFIFLKKGKQQLEGLPLQGAER